MSYTTDYQSVNHQTNDYMIPMNVDIVKNKHRSILDYIKYMIYYHNFYLFHNIPFILTNIVLLYFIEGPLWKKILTFFAAGFSSWAFHWFAHKSRIFNLISGHRLHHQDKTTIFEDAHEFLSDVFAAGLGLMLINYAIRFVINNYIKTNQGQLTTKFLFNNYVLLFFMVSFPLVHLFTYHRVLKESYHQEHHEQTKTNFSPDYFDHIFNTNQDHRIEDTSHMIPIFVIVGICIILIQKHKIIQF
jgi:small-conductance mechanosensitive channel